ncbi:MAG: ATP-binding cassette domain-containing protein [Candidatus Omnitrophica bacterium]|nr:ATP-binding cassette domain-containing protein [Candidatus Omnitrophota bacterium]
MVKLTVDNMGFSYPGVPVLEEISLKIRPGEVLAILGKNGAGKSTLLKCMNRILEPGTGKVFLGRRELRRMGRKDIARSMAYLSQKTTHVFPVTVFDVVLSGRYPHRVRHSDRKDETRVEQILRTLGLEDISTRSFNEISGGQQQQALIARAMVQEASVLLFDEPTSDLDIKHQLEVMETVRKIAREKNVAAVLTVHDLNLAARYADRVVMLKDGLIYAAGDIPSVLTTENIARVYGVEVLINEMEGRHHIIPVRSVQGERSG